VTDVAVLYEDAGCRAQDSGIGENDLIPYYKKSGLFGQD